MRVVTMSLICVTTFVPAFLAPDAFYLSLSRPSPVDALTERVEAPKLVIAVAVAVYSFLA